MFNIQISLLTKIETEVEEVEFIVTQLYKRSTATLHMK